MSMIDVLTRVDAICKKYDRYDADKHRNDTGGGDPFSRLYFAVDAEIDAAIEKSERAAREKNRAAAVTLNADVRHTKARIMEEVIKLQKLAVKKLKFLMRATSRPAKNQSSSEVNTRCGEVNRMKG